MSRRRTSQIRLSDNRGSRAQQLEFFAIFNLGIVQSLASGALTPTEAVHSFYHAANCLHVQRTLRSRDASEVMSRGTQLPDLVDALDADEARREFYHELEAIRVLCLKLLGRSRSLHHPGTRAAA